MGIIRTTRFSKFIWPFNTGLWASFILTDVMRNHAGSVAFDAIMTGLCLWASIQTTKDD